MDSENLMDLRWIEIQMWFFCKDIIKQKGDLMDIMTTIEFLGLFGDYNIEQVKTYALEIIHNPSIQPSRTEFLILSHNNKVPITEIKRRTKTHNKEIYEKVNANKTDPITTYIRLSEPKLIEIKKFLNTVEAFKNFGIFGRNQDGDN